MSWLKWVPGRQDTGYKKMLIYQFSVLGKHFDCYLLDYVQGDFIPQHTDPVPGKKHYRLNIELVRAIIGGELFFKDTKTSGWIHQDQRIVFFRSDIVPHKVGRIVKGKRMVLTFGAAV